MSENFDAKTKSQGIIKKKRSQGNSFSDNLSVLNLKIFWGSIPPEQS